MKFLVTGGRGFIGSHFVERCLDEGHKVIDIDSVTYAANEKLPWDNHKNYKHVKEDICDLKHLPSADISFISYPNIKLKSKAFLFSIATVATEASPDLKISNTACNIVREANTGIDVPQ